MMLPNGWKKSKIGETCSLLSGQDFPPNLYGNEEKGLPYITGASNFAGNHIILNRWTEHPKNIAKKGDILLVCKGSGFGITAIADFEKAHIARQVMALQKLNGVDRDFLYQVISMNVRNIKQKGCGLIPGIDRKTVLNIEYLLPPLEEQKKIAATLSVWDSAIEKMEKLIEAKEKVFNIVLKQNLLEKGIALKWKAIPLTEIIKSVTPPSKIHQDSYLNRGKYPIVDQSKDLIAGWTNDESSVLKTKRPLIIFGDHTCALKIMHMPFAQGADGIKILSAKDGYDPTYIYYAIKANPVIPEGYKRHFSALMLKSVLCPSFEEQKKYAAYFKSFDDGLSLLKQQLENYKKQKQGLMQKLLTGEWRVK